MKRTCKLKNVMKTLCDHILDFNNIFRAKKDNVHEFHHL